MLASLTSLWEARITAFLSESNDMATIHYKPTRTGSNVRFDEYHQESTNPADPTNIGVTEAEADTNIVYGKTHLDLYGLTLGAAEKDDQVEIGKFSNSDALFTCLLSSVITSSAGEKTKTQFHDSTYVILAKDNRRYEIDGIRVRGPGDAFLVDVYLSATNKKDL